MLGAGSRWVFFDGLVRGCTSIADAGKTAGQGCGLRKPTTGVFRRFLLSLSSAHPLSATRTLVGYPRDLPLHPGPKRGSRTRICIALRVVGTTHGFIHQNRSQNGQRFSWCAGSSLWDDIGNEQMNELLSHKVTYPFGSAKKISG